MNTVTTVNLGGNAYQLDERGYVKLRAYLEGAEKALAANPDKAEIIADLESAIGEKCRACLGIHKTVALESEIEQIIKEMGPVENADEKKSEEKNETETTDGNVPKKLYRVMDSAFIAGVCSGIAAYFSIDATLVRAVFILATFFTGGVFILGYIIMALVIPKADTPTERAAAYGAQVITAQRLIDQAKKGYEHLKQSHEQHRWKHSAHREQRQWKQWKKQEWRHERAMMRHHNTSLIGTLIGTMFGMLWILAWGFGLWFAYHRVPLVHDFFNVIYYYLSMTVEWVQAQSS